MKWINLKDIYTFQYGTDKTYCVSQSVEKSEVERSIKRDEDKIRGEILWYDICIRCSNNKRANRFCVFFLFLSCLVVVKWFWKEETKTEREWRDLEEQKRKRK